VVAAVLADSDSAAHGQRYVRVLQRARWPHKYPGTIAIVPGTLIDGRNADGISRLDKRASAHLSALRPNGSNLGVAGAAVVKAKCRATSHRDRMIGRQRTTVDAVRPARYRRRSTLMLTAGRRQQVARCRIPVGMARRIGSLTGTGLARPAVGHPKKGVP